jgi:H+/Cl- antiporter ClcA/CBS domain-containing protein
MSYLAKWLILASVIGVIAGLGAVVFYEALSASTHFFLGVLAGYKVPTPAGEGNAAGSAHYTRAWAIPLVVVLGALLSGFLVFTWAPEAEGHGTDAAIDAVHHNPRGIRLRAVVVKIAASALTIGSGGSGGREGPTAQISAGFGSLLARLLDLSPEDGRIAVSVGIGSGIGAIFSAPLGGAVLAADIVYRDDFEFEALLPGVFASIIAYAVFGAVFGYQPLFAIPGGYHFHQPIQLLWFALIGVLAGGLGLLYSKSFYGIVELSHRLPFSKKLRPALGALIVGLIALGLPEVVGTGYGWVQKGLSAQMTHTPLLIILALPLARILATGLSIGTGGSGGVFGPGMVIGAFTGLAVWRVLEPIAPGVGHDPAPFVIVGMMAVFGGISRAPVAVMLMVAQMTGSVAILGPAMIAVAIAWFIVGRADDSIYRSQLRTRADSAVNRLQFGLPLLATLNVSGVVNPAKVVLNDAMTVGESLALLREASVPGAPVVDENASYTGTVDVETLAGLAESSKGRRVGDFADATATTVAFDASLDVGLEALVQAGGHWVAVTTKNREVAGILAISDIVRSYRQSLDTNIGKISQITSHAVAVEERVGPLSKLIGAPIRSAGLPAGCVVITVQRGNDLLFATGSTTFEEGDVVSSLTSPQSVAQLRRLTIGVADEQPVATGPGTQLS